MKYNFHACISDVYNNMIFTGNNSFYHAHELTHIYVSKKYKTAYHNFWSEGIATYLGGSQSKDLAWHLAKVKKYASENPSMNFNDLLSFIQEPSYEELTNLDYALGGLFCKLIYEKQGIKGIDAIFNSGNSDTGVYEIIEKILGIKKENLNEFVRKELMKY
jgi:hypothetical protein